MVIFMYAAKNSLNEGSVEKQRSEEIGIPTVGFVPDKHLKEQCASCGKQDNVVDMGFSVIIKARA